MEHPHSSVNNLLNHLQNVYTIKTSDFPDKGYYQTSKKKSHSQNPDQHFREPKATLTEQHQQELKDQMSKLYRHPWRANGLVHHNDQQVKRLPIGDLDNWQIYRINLAQRSYDCPKKYKGMKIPSVGKQFVKYDCKDKDGHMPYLYESDIEKINRIKSNIYSKTFKRTNTVKHQLFGFPTSKPKPSTVKRPISQITFPQKNKDKLKVSHI